MNTIQNIAICGILALLLLVCTLSGADATYHLLKLDPSVILLKGNFIDITQEKAQHDETSQERATYLLHFSTEGIKSKHDEILSTLRNLNMNIGGYVPTNTWIVTATGEKVQEAKKQLGEDTLRWASTLEHKHKTIDLEHARVMAEKILADETNSNKAAHILLDIGEHDAADMKKTFNTLKKAATQLLEGNSQATSKLSVISNRQLILSVTGLDSKALTTYFKNILSNGVVHWAQFHTPSNTQSKFASRLVQDYDHPTAAPMWKDGLTGEDEIIGVGDTGLDIDHCDFYDEHNHVRQLTEVPTHPLGPTKHRKIQSYFGAIDFKDSTGGHGTHVCGLAAGSPNQKLSPKSLKGYRSIAYKSKLAFMDLGCDSPQGCKCPKTLQCECDVRPGFKCPAKSGVVFLPLDLYGGYFPYFKKAGAAIVSSSWGSGFFHDYSYGYSSLSVSVDRYTWENREMLPIFAAGNSGAAWGYETLTSEGEAKNALVVGASQNTFESFLPRHGIKVNHKPMVLALRIGLIRRFCDVRSKLYSAALCKAARGFKTEKDCCGTIADARKCKGKKNCCGNQRFKLQVGFKCCSKCIHRLLRRGNTRRFNKENMALFSARGPTTDGRIKPDIVTVGHQLTSSRAQGANGLSKTCNPSMSMRYLVKKMSGTSMATPVAASAAALVRQYYRKGFYSKLAPGSLVKGGFTPSAALIKATLIQSAHLLSGYVHMSSMRNDLSLKFKKGFNMELRQSSFQGFGAINLEHSLGKKANLYLPNGNRDRDISTGELHHFCFHMPVKQKWRVTLVWTDYPSSPASHVHLVNDLDLLVVSPHGEVSYGNGKFSNIKTAITEPDSLNNVERLDFNPDTMSYSRGYYRVVVRGNHIPKGPQPYALVVSSPGSSKPVTRVRLSRCPQYTSKSNHFIMNSIAHHKAYLIRLGKNTLKQLKKCRRRSRNRGDCQFLSKQLVSVAKEIKKINNADAHHH